jgi:hypothetical protein
MTGTPVDVMSANFEIMYQNFIACPLSPCLRTGCTSRDPLQDPRPFPWDLHVLLGKLSFAQIGILWE